MRIATRKQTLIKIVTKTKMKEYTNDKGEVVVIADMESRRLIHAIAKYADQPELVKTLKTEAIKRLDEHNTDTR